MTTRQAFIAATAFSVAGTGALASWLALSPSDFSRDVITAAPLVAAPSASASPEMAVAETEAAVLPPPSAPAETFAAARPEAAAPAVDTQPAARPATTRRQPAIDRAVREQPPPRAEQPREPAQTPVVFEREPEPEPEREPRTEPAEPMEPVEPMEPAQPLVLVVPPSSVLGVRLEDGVSSESAEIEDRVEASVTRDVMVGGRIAIPAGTRIVGSVSEVTRGGKFRETARLGVRFHTLVMDDGSRVPVRVDTIVREGESPAKGSATKIGATAVGGAIIGGIMGGKKGAVLGGIAGAGAGTGVVATGDRSVAELVTGAPLSLRLLSPATVMIERR